MDARNVRNIVLMRPLNSMIEFKQIIARGTRLSLSASPQIKAVVLPVNWPPAP